MVIALEGGYNLRAISRSMESCVRVLLGEAPRPPFPRAQNERGERLSRMCAEVIGEVRPGARRGGARLCVHVCVSFVCLFVRVHVCTQVCVWEWWVEL